MSSHLFLVTLLSRLPLAPYRRYDGTFFLKFGESLVHLLAISTQSLRNVACRDGFPSLVHGL